MSAVEIDWQDGREITNVRAAQILTEWPIRRVLPEILGGTNGLRFEFENGAILDWVPPADMSLLPPTS